MVDSSNVCNGFELYVVPDEQREKRAARPDRGRVQAKAGSSGSCVFLCIFACYLEIYGIFHHKYCYDRYEKLQPSTSHLFRTTNFETSSLLLIFNPTKTEDATENTSSFIIHHHSSLIIYIMLSDFRAKKVFDCKLQPRSTNKSLLSGFVKSVTRLKISVVKIHDTCEEYVTEEVLVYSNSYDTL